MSYIQGMINVLQLYFQGLKTSSGVANVLHSGVDKVLHSGVENTFHSWNARVLHSGVDKRLTAAHNFNIYGL